MVARGDDGGFQVRLEVEARHRLGGVGQGAHLGEGVAAALEEGFGLVRIGGGGEEAVGRVMEFGVGQIHAGLVGEQPLARPDNLDLMRRGQTGSPPAPHAWPVRRRGLSGRRT